MMILTMKNHRRKRRGLKSRSKTNPRSLRNLKSQRKGKQRERRNSSEISLKLLKKR